MTGVVVPELRVVTIGYRQGAAAVGLALMQLPPGAEIVTSGPISENPTLVPAWRRAATAMTTGVVWSGELAAGWQFAGEPTGRPSSLPAATTMITPLSRSAVNASEYAAVQAPLAPRLMLITRAGCALAGTPLTAMPPAHWAAAMMSSS